MRTIFMGTPEFAVPSLKALISVSDVVAVFTQTDKKSGRKLSVHYSPVKDCALNNNLKILQPTTLKDPECFNIIKDLCPDLIVVAAYGKILPKDILSIPKYGCINIHASILHKYRGASPIQYAILNGDRETGVTVMQMDSGVDTGDILYIKKTEIGETETFQHLSYRLSQIGAECLTHTLDIIENGTLIATPQPAGDFTYAALLSKEDSDLDFHDTCSNIYNKIRAFNPWPGCRVKIDNKIIKIISAIPNENFGLRPGEVISGKKKLSITCGDLKCIDILEVQPEGKNKMSIESYLAGNKIKNGLIL